MHLLLARVKDGHQPRAGVREIRHRLTVGIVDI
jgi:hypothetical protein